MLLRAQATLKSATMHPHAPIAVVGFLFGAIVLGAEALG
jgi:hypothetical protein